MPTLRLGEADARPHRRTGSIASFLREASAREQSRLRPVPGAVGTSPRGDPRVPKRHEALSGPAGARRRLALARGAGRRDLRAGRPVGLRQDHRDADGQPHDQHHRRRHPARWPQRDRAQAGRPAPRDRLRDPADRAVPASVGGRQHRHRAAAAGLVEGAHPRARRRAARAGQPRSGQVPRPLPPRALRRPAAASRGRAWPRGTPAWLLAGRTTAPRLGRC